MWESYLTPALPPMARHTGTALHPPPAGVCVCVCVGVRERERERESVRACVHVWY